MHSVMCWSRHGMELGQDCLFECPQHDAISRSLRKMAANTMQCNAAPASNLANIGGDAAVHACSVAYLAADELLVGMLNNSARVTNTSRMAMQSAMPCSWSRGLACSVLDLLETTSASQLCPHADSSRLVPVQHQSKARVQHLAHGDRRHQACTLCLYVLRRVRCPLLRHVVASSLHTSVHMSLLATREANALRMSRWTARELDVRDLSWMLHAVHSQHAQRKRRARRFLLQHRWTATPLPCKQRGAHPAQHLPRETVFFCVSSTGKGSTLAGSRPAAALVRLSAGQACEASTELCRLETPSPQLLIVPFAHSRGAFRKQDPEPGAVDRTSFCCRGSRT